MFAASGLDDGGMGDIGTKVFDAKGELNCTLASPGLHPVQHYPVGEAVDDGIRLGFCTLMASLTIWGRMGAFVHYLF